jgi:hypothetical protein
MPAASGAAVHYESRAGGTMTAAAQRQRRRRERQRAGKALLRIEVDEVGLAEALCRHGFLAPLKADDKAALEGATEYVLGVWAKSVTRDNSD